MVHPFFTEPVAAAGLSPFKDKTSYIVMANYPHEYYLKNREIKIEKKLASIMQKIEAMREKRKERTTCACGVVLRKDCMSKHRKTKQHV